jgi:prevent-host-death family protein
MDIPAAVFKAECLKLMDEVARTGQPVVITKHGKPVAQLVPIPAQSSSFHARAVVAAINECIASRYSHLALVCGRHY